MECKTFDYLPQEARNIRVEVFVKEQGFEYEFDSFDEKATHIIIFDNNKAVATCRYFNQDGYYLIGRIAVIKEYRGLGLGAKLLEFAKLQIDKLGGKEIRIHAQKRVEGFYIKQGYEAFGETDFDEGCEHVWLRRSIN
ncbi:MAG: GNAT family N-acetyltransferase [Clostridia bacterium]|nr:GNAT family N-acetyltransferase [Clostridia bacterium]